MSQYTLGGDPPQSRAEQILMGEDIIPQSRLEELLLEKNVDPQSRIEDLLNEDHDPGSVVLINKTIIENGIYDAASDNADGYKRVAVNVPNTYGASDEGKVVSNGALVAQTAHAEVTENCVVDTTLNNSVTVNVPQGSTPTGTKTINISANGTTTEDVTAYANAQIVVAVPIPTYPIAENNSFGGGS